MTGASIGLIGSPAHSAEGIPGNDVSRQQVVNPRTKTKSPSAPARARLQKAIWRTGNCWKFTWCRIIYFASWLNFSWLIRVKSKINNERDGSLGTWGSREVQA